jgi:putative transposase
MIRNEPIVDGQYYHVYNRGNRKQPIFGEDSDYRSFLRKLRDASWTYRVRIVVYTLMPNHFHFVLVQGSDGSIQRFMNSVESSVAKHFNLKYGEVGHLFQGRYGCNRIDSDESLLIVARYIHLNPVAARLVLDPEDWPYSDYAEFVRLANNAKGVLRPDEGVLLARDKGVLQPGGSSDEGRLLHDEGRLLPCSVSEYVEMVRNHMDKGVLPPGSVFEEERLLP